MCYFILLFYGCRSYITFHAVSKGWRQTIFRMLIPGTVTKIKLKLKKLQYKLVKLETYLGLSHCRFDFAFFGAVRAPNTLSLIEEIAMLCQA